MHILIIGENMEFIKNAAQFEKMIDNKIIGEPELINSKINFFGKGNILICKKEMSLKNVILDFHGDNSLVYLESNLNDFFRLNISHDSLLFVGKDVDFGVSNNISIFEGQNVIIGDECMIGDNVSITTSDNSPIYSFSNKERINFSASILIGDHVLIGNNSFISKNVKIGSGSIIDSSSFIQSNVIIHSNVQVSGNPVKIIKEKVFFTKDFLNTFNSEDSFNSKNYKSDVFMFNVDAQETLNMNHVDEILKEFDVESKIEFVEKLFIKNKRKNRFSL